MDYSVMLQEHVVRGAELSVACIEVPLAEACGLGVMVVDEDERIVAFEEKPACPTPLPSSPGRALASMGVYVFNADVLFAELAHDAADPTSSHDFGHDLIPQLIGQRRVYAHRFARSCINSVEGQPYWRDVGTVDAYWEANMDLTRVLPELNLYDDTWPILSQIPQLPPAKFVFDEDGGRRGYAVDSLVASGCIVSGAVVRRSVLFCKARVDEGSVVEDSLVLPDTRVGRGVTLRRAIVDKRCRLPDGFTAGVDRAADLARGFHVSPSGITLVTQEMLEGGLAQAGAGAPSGICRALA
jgi:glucose-1-phosphate adenylyltransferase